MASLTPNGRGTPLLGSSPAGSQLAPGLVRSLPGSLLNRLQPRNSQRGYTLIELVIVMAIVGILISIAIPMYTNSIRRANETVLKNNLFQLRTMIDEYTFDRKAAPQTLEDLVAEGYINSVPVDPVTKSNQTWVLIIEDTVTAVDQTQPGIFDVRSGSDLVSLEGTPYSEW